MINIIALKFKFDCRRLTRISVKIIRAERKSFLESDLKLSRDRNKRINHDFLNISSEHEKCSENHKRAEVYSSQKKANKFWSFIFQCFWANQQVHAATHHLSYKFSRIFDILKRVRPASKIKMQIMYKRKTQKTNSIDVDILDELKPETNSKWRKILKSSVTVDSLKQLKELYDFFLTFKFSKISRDSRMILKRLQKMLFDAELFFQERNLLIEMLYRRETALT